MLNSVIEQQGHKQCAKNLFETKEIVWICFQINNPIANRLIHKQVTQIYSTDSGYTTLC